MLLQIVFGVLQMIPRALSLWSSQSFVDPAEMPGHGIALRSSHSVDEGLIGQRREAVGRGLTGLAQASSDIDLRPVVLEVAGKQYVGRIAQDRDIAAGPRGETMHAEGDVTADQVIVIGCGPKNLANSFVGPLQPEAPDTTEPVPVDLAQSQPRRGSSGP
jgi:hypothetical protein